MDEQRCICEEYLQGTTSRGLLLTNRAGGVVYVNRRFFALTGVAPAPSEGMLLADLLAWLPEQPGWQGVNKEQFLQRLAPLRSRSYQQIELFFHPERWLQWTGRAMQSGGYAVTLTDVTRMHMAMNALQQSNKSTIKSIADMAENRDNDTGEHVLRVARMAHELAVDLIEHGVFPDQLTHDTLAYLALSSMLHDVGKVAVPDGILLKPSILTPDERAIMQGHAEAGYRIIRKIQDTQLDSAYFECAARIARSHHEQWTGGGYPKGLRGEEIPVEARIVAVSDVLDALTSWRPYKAPWTEERAIAFIQEKSGQLFDPLVVESLHRVLRYRRESECMAWSEEMGVGEGTMDRDHRILIDLINQLARAHRRQDGVIMEFVVDELYNYTMRHFQREEAYMQAGGYPRLLAHRRLHRQFTRRVTDVRQQFYRNFDPAIAVDLTQALSTWLQQHIMGVDQEYRKYFVSTGEPSADWQSVGNLL
ncbi:MAG: bacteriohemerythrin [Magnetococcus sp. XQGC-1]